MLHRLGKELVRIMHSSLPYVDSSTDAVHDYFIKKVAVEMRKLDHELKRYRSSSISSYV